MSDDPVQQMKEAMIRETFNEVGPRAFMAGIMAGCQAIQLDMSKVLLKGADHMNQWFNRFPFCSQDFLQLEELII